MLLLHTFQSQEWLCHDQFPMRVSHLRTIPGEVYACNSLLVYSGTGDQKHVQRQPPPPTFSCTCTNCVPGRNSKGAECIVPGTPYRVRVWHPSQCSLRVTAFGDGEEGRQENGKGLGGLDQCFWGCPKRAGYGAWTSRRVTSVRR